MNFSCLIDGPLLRCTVTTDRDLTAPVLCFSGMTQMTATEGGERINGLGSYTEVQLPDLVKDTPHNLVLAYIGFEPANRAWMPLGPYLRTRNGCVALPPIRPGIPSVKSTGTVRFQGPRLVPQPSEWQPTGNTTKVDSFSSDDDALISIAALAKRRGLGSFLDDHGHCVTVVTEAMNDDEYRLEINNDGITLVASTYGGRFYAGITLLSLVTNHAGDIPCGVIIDKPRFSWRGQHLDCARHYYKPNTIHDLLDLMALMKLNRFHWHFADDEAFRLQIESYPELWKRTEIRGEGHLMPALFSGAIEAGGSYSKDEVGQLIARAKELNIEILPEIEGLSHALAMTRVFPDLLDPDDTGMEKSVQGYQDNIINPAMPKTWEIVTAIATEVGTLFPFGHVHLGCDELPDNTWMDSPAARLLMEKEGLRSTQDLQGWAISKMAATVVQNGQRPAAWEEAALGANGGIGHDAILFSWTGKATGYAAARAGYDVVMTPAQHVYLDMAETNSLDDWGASWAAFIALEDTIAWDPVPKDEPELEEHIIGVQGAFWSEFTTEDDQIWPMLLPRILGVAVKAWQATDISADNLHWLAENYNQICQSFCRKNAQI